MCIGGRDVFDGGENVVIPYSTDFVLDAQDSISSNFPFTISAQEASSSSALLTWSICTVTASIAIASIASL
jgi:hypothetical protein